jgi:hypothetical protein
MSGCSRAVSAAVSTGHRTGLTAPMTGLMGQSGRGHPAAPSGGVAQMADRASNPGPAPGPAPAASGHQGTSTVPPGAACPPSNPQGDLPSKSVLPAAVDEGCDAGKRAVRLFSC